MGNPLVKQHLNVCGVAMQVDDEDEVTIIDFPQMVSVAHPNAQELFDRDAECVVRYFTRKLGYVPEHDSSLTELRPNFAVGLPFCMPL